MESSKIVRDFRCRYLACAVFESEAWLDSLAGTWQKVMLLHKQLLMNGRGPRQHMGFDRPCNSLRRARQPPLTGC